MGQEKIAYVDSEIALTAFLAAGVTAYPISRIRGYPLIQLIAISLLFLTLIRRMAVLQGIQAENSLLKVTTYILDPATYISILYLVIVLNNWIAPANKSGTVSPPVFAITAIVVIFLLFFGWELVFRAALREGERVFSAKADEHGRDLLGVFLLKFSRYIKSERVYNEPITEQRQINDYLDNTRKFEDLDDEEKVELGMSMLSTTAGVLLALLAYPALAILHIVFFSTNLVTAFLLLLSVVVTAGFVRLWYSRYGVIKAEDRSGYIVFLNTLITYGFISWILLL
jgi:hypothetical protein